MDIASLGLILGNREGLTVRESLPAALIGGAVGNPGIGAFVTARKIQLDVANKVVAAPVTPTLPSGGITAETAAAIAAVAAAAPFAAIQAAADPQAVQDGDQQIVQELLAAGRASIENVAQTTRLAEVWRNANGDQVPAVTAAASAVGAPLDVTIVLLAAISGSEANPTPAAIRVLAQLQQARLAAAGAAAAGALLGPRPAPPPAELPAAAEARLQAVEQGLTQIARQLEELTALVKRK